MPTYLTPGVYVEELPSQSKPIEGVGTSVAAFVGLAPAGPTDTPVRIANWGQFARMFGSAADPEAGPFMDGAYLAHAVFGYFQNGGGLCWVVRVGGSAEPQALQAALPAAEGDGEPLRVVAANGATGLTVELSEDKPDAPADGDAKGESTYTIVVTGGDEREEFTGLTAKKGRTSIATQVNAKSKLIKVEEVGSLPEGARAPRPGTYKLAAPATAASELSSPTFAGDEAKRTGIGSLVAIDEITMVACPDLAAMAGSDEAGFRDVQGKMLAHCETAADRLAILDPPPGLLPSEILEWRQETAGYDSKQATLYWPWLEVMDPLTGTPIHVPPCGHVAGAWARTDATRGVHKAPANETLLGVNGLAFQITQAEQGALNQAGINCIRAFSGRGIRIWGARTLSSDPEWRYLNVRRLFNYVAESIMEGTQWAVFEPNDERLWTQMRIAVSNFLTRTWSEGALFGATPEQSFYVKCDEETNPPEIVEAGQVICEIGIAPVKPAEFVVFRISQYSAGAEIAA